MKLIKYSICTSVNTGTEEAPQMEDVLSTVTLGWSAANEEIARQEAYNGEYTIEDDGQPDPADVPSQLDAIEAQVAYTALMTNTLLEV